MEQKNNDSKKFFEKIKQFFSNGKNFIDFVKNVLKIVSMISDMLKVDIEIYYKYYPTAETAEQVKQDKF